jgi:hypothetical protein
LLKEHHANANVSPVPVSRLEAVQPQLEFKFDAVDVRFILKQWMSSLGNLSLVGHFNTNLHPLILDFAIVGTKLSKF